MKKDILCYFALILAITLFICTTVFLEPIPLLEEEMDYDKLPENIEFNDIDEYGLENKDKVEEKYIGEILLKDKWIYFTLLFTNYKDEFIEEYEKYNNEIISDEKTAYENKVYSRYGINTQEERDNLYNALKNTEYIVKIEVLEDTINNLDNGINFDIKATDQKGKETLFNSTIFNQYIDENYVKILSK